MSYCSKLLNANAWSNRHDALPVPVSQFEATVAYQIDERAGKYIRQVESQGLRSVLCKASTALHKFSDMESYISNSQAVNPHPYGR